jgi:hypothetical protein
MCQMTAKAARKPKVDPDSIETEWSGWIMYGEPENPERSGAGVRGDTIPELFADVMKTATYYLAMGYVVRMKDVKRYCCRCHGEGAVFTRPYQPRKRCPECKGIGVFGELGDIGLDVHDNVVLRAPWMEPQTSQV